MSMANGTYDALELAVLRADGMANYPTRDRNDTPTDGNGLSASFMPGYSPILPGTDLEAFLASDLSVKRVEDIREHL